MAQTGSQEMGPQGISVGIPEENDFGHLDLTVCREGQYQRTVHYFLLSHYAGYSNA